MFDKFSTTPYSLDGYSKEAMNILTAAIVKHVNVDQAFVYQRYIVPAGTSPESLAYELYSDADKYWTILLVNGIVNPFLDWPMDAHTLEEYVKVKYTDPESVLYFTNLQTGKQYDDVASEAFYALLENGDPLPQNVHPVSPLEHEANENSRKSEIMVIAPRYINIFVDTFNKSIQGIE